MEPVQGRKDHISQENPNPNDDQSKRKGTKRIIYRFFHYTTINGLQRMASSGTILGRLFWILVLLGAGGMFSRDIYTLVQQFFERPISVVSRVEYFRVRSRMIIFADVYTQREDCGENSQDKFQSKSSIFKDEVKSVLRMCYVMTLWCRNNTQISRCFDIF
jgi:hypothetical protein